jgi:pimeloyl-ACP methyl ester carboxylesterase
MAKEEIEEITWKLIRPKSFPNGLTLELMPGVGHFPQVENPQWVAERLIHWVRQNSD